MTQTQTPIDSQDALNKVIPIEQYLNRPLPHLREMAEVNPEGLDPVLTISGLMGTQGTLTPSQHAVARLIATQAQDCGSCLQIDIDLAMRAGVAPDLIRAVVEHRRDAIHDETLRSIYDLVQAAVTMQPVAEAIDTVTEKLGQRALTDVAVAVALSQFFPVLKRVMGHATSCQATPPNFAQATPTTV